MFYDRYIKQKLDGDAEDAGFCTQVRAISREVEFTNNDSLRLLISWPNNVPDEVTMIQFCRGLLFLIVWSSDDPHGGMR